MKVHQQIITDSYNHFVEVFYPDRTGMGMEYWNFLGWKHRSTYPIEGDKWELPDDAAHRAMLLAGPHYKAVAKIMVLRGHKWQQE